MRDFIRTGAAALIFAMAGAASAEPVKLGDTMEGVIARRRSGRPSPASLVPRAP